MYEFLCVKCGHHFEELVGPHVETKMGDVTCPECGAEKPNRLAPSSITTTKGLTAGQKRRLEAKRGRPAGRGQAALPGAALEGEESGGAPIRAQGEPLMEAASRREALVEVYNRASVCEKCPLSETRNQVVFGSGNSDADLMFVGEAPGAEEDRQGLPFVGRAGALPHRAAGGDRAEARGRVHRQRPQVPAARQPRSPARGDRFLPALARDAGRADPAADHRHARELRHQAADRAIRPGSPRSAAPRRSARSAGGRSSLLPLFHPAAGLRTPQVAEQLREDFKLIPGLLDQPLPEPPPAARRGRARSPSRTRWASSAEPAAPVGSAGAPSRAASGRDRRSPLRPSARG